MLRDVRTAGAEGCQPRGATWSVARAAGAQRLWQEHHAARAGRLAPASGVDCQIFIPGALGY